ncbi:MAG: hypothetical protein KGD63_11770 [Candidatus Lokiarchaeota archaeon]|nr:hypothetical protein [Candidatus Lokiarchaeota archaeon]
MVKNKIISKLSELIKEFTDSQDDVQGQIVISFPIGVPIANTWKGKINPILIGALSAAVKLTFQNLCLRLNKGNLRRLSMSSEYGRAIIQNAGDNAILTTIIEGEADLLRVAFGITNLSLKIKDLLKNYNFTGEV